MFIRSLLEETISTTYNLTPVLECQEKISKIGRWDWICNQELSNHDHGLLAMTLIKQDDIIGPLLKEPGR